jgi:mono/diheme cytochrome c family protein
MEANRYHLVAVRPALAVVGLALLVVSCAPGYTAPPVSAQLAKASPTPQSRLERGYQVHQAKCAKCHPFEDPADYEVAALTHEIMPVMARKSKLEPADAQAVLAYLLAARKLPPPLKEG